ncbi:TraB/GumN family protein [Loktanella sp. IMCC34160]|uniref:TraB/GumN family protein n=1 Tax=Loktanella sp. IMCC34160 TaxID=2510646 RepID=UPI00101C286F|nr:TraB/GumN family protein [Loktanella sp. IMCC34160]RYG92996.1 TraB/GumN family protein [Loktanella sp. IMCC34160]
MRLFRSLAALALSAGLGTPVAALCDGPPITEMLTQGELTDLSELIAQTPFADGLYWEATRGEEVLHILGTIHLPDRRLPKVFGMAFPDLSGADLLLVEATLEDQRALQRHIVSNPPLFTITEGPTLPDLLAPDIWAALEQAAIARGIPGFMAAKMQPWFLSLNLSMAPCAAAAMAAGDVGLDTMLMNAVADTGTQVQSLEDWRTTLDFLASGTFEEQVTGLEASLMPNDVQDAMMVALTDAYFEGQPIRGWYLAKITGRFVPSMTAEEFDALFAEMEQTMLTDRNIAWIPVIETAASATDGPVFIAFGAAHLPGDTGVLSLLQANGWTLTRLDG